MLFTEQLSVYEYKRRCQETVNDFYQLLTENSNSVFTWYYLHY